jgi:hypothetical protein
MFPSAFIICQGCGLFWQFILSSIFLHNPQNHAAENPLFWNNLKFKWNTGNIKEIYCEKNALCQMDVQKSDKYTKYSSII